MTGPGDDPAASSSAAEPIPESVLGYAEFAQRAVEMARAARHEVLIFSYDLDRRIYGTEPLVDQLRTFLLQHRRGRLRGIVNSTRSATRGAHRLVELSRMLSSRIEFRELPPDRREWVQDYLIVDERMLLIRDHPQELEARFYASAPLLASEQLRQFETHWQHSDPAREFDRLSL